MKEEGERQKEGKRERERERERCVVSVKGGWVADKHHLIITTKTGRQTDRQATYGQTCPPVSRRS